MKDKKLVQMYVSPEFRKELKRRAVEQDISVAKLTRKLAKKLEKKGGGYDFPSFKLKEVLPSTESSSW